MVIPHIDINWFLLVLTCLFMLLDLVTGFVQALVNKCVDSGKMRAGLLHKCGFLLAIVLAILCETAVKFVDLGLDIPFVTAVCTFIIITEIASNLENLILINPKLADNKFLDIFKPHNRE